MVGVRWAGRLDLLGLNFVGINRVRVNRIGVFFGRYVSANFIVIVVPIYRFFVSHHIILWLLFLILLIYLFELFQLFPQINHSTAVLVCRRALNCRFWWCYCFRIFTLARLQMLIFLQRLTPAYLTGSTLSLLNACFKACFGLLSWIIRCGMYCLWTTLSCLTCYWC